MVCDSFDTLEAVAAAIPRERWILIGGLMVHCHARQAGVVPARPTHDADLLAKIATDEVAWQMCDPDDWAKAVRAARGIDHEWMIPTFIRPPRPSGRRA